MWVSSTNDYINNPIPTHKIQETSQKREQKEHKEEFSRTLSSGHVMVAQLMNSYLLPLSFSDSCLL